MSYKTIPNIGTMREFKDIDDYNKENHPVQFLFKDTIPDWFSFKKFWLREKYWEVLHRVHPKHRYHVINTGLKPGYYDIPELMLQVNFKFLERYVEDEDCFNTIVWYDDGCERAFVGSELQDLYFWWKTVRPKREYIEQEYYSKVSDHLISEASEEDCKIYKELNKLEVFWSKEDEYNLCRLMKLRPWMWS